jgi:hypothetical protein
VNRVRVKVLGVILGELIDKLPDLCPSYVIALPVINRDNVNTTKAPETTDISTSPTRIPVDANMEKNPHEDLLRRPLYRRSKP